MEFTARSTERGTQRGDTLHRDTGRHSDGFCEHQRPKEEAHEVALLVIPREVENDRDLTELRARLATDLENELQATAGEFGPVLAAAGFGLGGGWGMSAEAAEDPDARWRA